jgi:FKBP-type peptidyl-prolyl cis-trans isomerase (trigger factor)
MTLPNYLKSVGKTEEEWVETEIKPLAEKRVRMGLTLAKLSAELKITASNEEVAQKVVELRAVHRNNAEVLKQLEQDQVLQDIHNRLMTEKTVDELVALNA